MLRKPLRPLRVPTKVPLRVLPTPRNRDGRSGRAAPPSSSSSLMDGVYDRMDEPVELEASDARELMEETVPSRRWLGSRSTAGKEMMELVLASEAWRLVRVEMMEGTARPEWPLGVRGSVGGAEATTRSSRTESESGSTREMRLSCALSNGAPSSVGVDSGEERKKLSLDFFLPRALSIILDPGRARFFLLAMYSTSSCELKSASESSGSS